MHPLLRFAKREQSAIIAFIREMVECESPSDSPQHVDRFIDLLIERTSDIAVAKTFKSSGYGRQLRLEFKTFPKRKQGRILGLGHADTVWPAGTLRQMPFRNRNGRLWGPGVLDMKAGLAFFIYAIRALIALDIAVPKLPVLLVVSDEEIGSPASRRITESEAKRSDLVLVVEPGTGITGKLKTARKGVGRYIVSIEGRAAHAGVDFENGASAIVEAARLVERIASLTDVSRGVTVNPGVISGGTRSNVIAAWAQIEVDLRVERASDAVPLRSQAPQLASSG